MAMDKTIYSHSIRKTFESCSSADTIEGDTSIWCDVHRGPRRWLYFITLWTRDREISVCAGFSMSFWSLCTMPMPCTESSHYLRLVGCRRLEELRPYRKRCMIYLTQFLALCLFFFSCAAARLRPEVKRALFAVCLYEKLTAHGERQHELFCILFLDIFLLFFNLLFFFYFSSSSRHRTDPTLH